MIKFNFKQHKFDIIIQKSRINSNKNDYFYINLPLCHNYIIYNDIFSYIFSISVMLNWSQIPEPPIRKQKINMLFSYIDEELNQFLEKITKIYKQNGIKYYVKPHHQYFMRLLIPSELKAYSNLSDIICLFDNRNDLMRSALEKKKIEIDEGYQTIPKIDKNYMEGFIRKKICEWAKLQVLNGQNILRSDVKIKAEQIAKQHNLKLGARWMKAFLSHDPQLINLLTHGNCSKIKRDTKGLEKKQFSYHLLDQKKIKQEQKQIMKNDNEEYSSAYGAYSDDQFLMEQNYWEDNEQKYQNMKESKRYPDEPNQKSRKENKNQREIFRQKFQEVWQKHI